MCILMRGLIFVVACCMTSSAVAGMISPFVPLATNVVKFRNYENILDATTGLKKPIGASIAVGDRLRGVLFTETVTAFPPGGSGTSPNSIGVEIGGIFDIEAIRIDGTGASQTITFGPSGEFGAGGSLGSLGLDPKTMVAFYRDTVLDTQSTFVDNTKTELDIEAAIANGRLLGNFGYGTGGTDPGDIGAAGNGYWFSNGLDFFYGLELLDPLAGETPSLFTELTVSPMLNPDLVTALHVPPSTLINDNLEPFGTTLFALDGRGENRANSGPTGARTDLYNLRSEDPAYIFPNPEPSSFLLLLVGMGGAQLMRRRNKEE